ncbi:MAG: phage tail protein [Clostridiales bacterium]|nr:phage tail protein [Clostridiales bacterium]
MYRVYCDGLPIYNDKLEGLKIFSPSLDLELNKTGSFSFTLYPDHPYYGSIQKLKSIITVYREDYLLFRGRVLDDEIGFYNERKVTCEGELAFLLDSIKRPYDFTGSVAEYLALLLESHNAQVDETKRFTLGNVTVTDPNDYIVRSNIDYTDTWKEMNDKLLTLLGGFLSVRHADGVAYLDYLADFALLSPQKIEFGKNLLDQKRIIKGADVATVVIPLGAKLKDAEGKDTDKRLTIETVNGGADFIEDASAISQYGTIVKTVIFDDVTIAENLKAKGQAYLSSLVKLPESIELTAADLATVSTAFSSFHLGTYVDVVSKPHGLNQKFLVRKLSIHLLDPAANKLTLGGVFEGLAASLKGLTDTQGKIINEISESVRKASEAVYNVEQNLESSIRQSEENIKATVAESYYLKDETDALVSSVSTTIEQTKESVEIQFTQFNADLEAVANGADAEFEEIRKYIRFVDGSILLGQVGNELELKISNDRISFLQDDTEVAYFSDNKLYVTDGHFINALQIGDFAFIPRANGNLSFKRLDARNNGSIVGYATIDATKVM